eukprot:GHVT01019576.1.p3 GENE.GHVT01019576.1~~GHVT01019576.1.p3  ORF type:complete len:121 (+),score=21.67 GHVT01019576.1:743-1105(+)
MRLKDEEISRMSSELSACRVAMSTMDHPRQQAAELVERLTAATVAAEAQRGVAIAELNEQRTIATRLMRQKAEVERSLADLLRSRSAMHRVIAAISGTETQHCNPKGQTPTQPADTVRHV